MNIIPKHSNIISSNRTFFYVFLCFPFGLRGNEKNIPIHGPIIFPFSRGAEEEVRLGAHGVQNAGHLYRDVSSTHHGHLAVWDDGLMRKWRGSGTGENCMVCLWL